MLFGFNAWNWYLAFSGLTVLEFTFGANKDEVTKGFETISDNLYLVFGTYKIFRVLSPSLRSIPFSGLEWSFFWKDSGFDETGKRVKSAERDEDLEMVLIK